LASWLCLSKASKQHWCSLASQACSSGSRRDAFQPAYIGMSWRERHSPLGNAEVSTARMAPLLLLAKVRGERVPKQTSAEATNGKPVST
jgi:hypothetical protein